MTNKREQLQDLLENQMIDVLEQGVRKYNDDGKVITVTPSSGYLNTIRQYLKDFPPETMPNTGRVKGKLQEHEEKVIPFN